MPILSSFGAMSAIGRAQRAGERKRVALVLSANVNNYVLDVAKVAGYEPGNTDVELIVNAGVVIGSTSTGSFALDIDTSWATGDTIKIVNNGTIAGYGAAAAAGGPALRAQRPVSIDNAAGIVAGAGGGGGNGGGCSCPTVDCDTTPSGYQSCTPGTGGAGQGSQGTATIGTSGTIIGYCCGGFTGICGNGGAGGAYGSQGAAGANSAGICSNTGQTGLGAGACTSGNANITWIAVGTRHGALN